MAAKSTRAVVIENLSVALAMPLMLLLMEQLHDESSRARLAIEAARERLSEFRAELSEWRTARRADVLIADLESTLETEASAS